MKRLIVGITGASGVIYGIRALEMLKGSEIESHLILSPAAKATIAQETDYKVSNVIALAQSITIIVMWAQASRRDHSSR